MPRQPSPSETKDGAERLARSIREFWGLQGFIVNTRVESTKSHAGGDFGKSVFEVKTDMINGLPRNWKPPHGKSKPQ